MLYQASHDVLYPIGIVQATGLSSSHQSLGNYLEGKSSWALFDLTNQDFPALKSASLNALPQSQLVLPPVHRVLCTPVPLPRHRVVTCCDHFPSRRPHCVSHRPRLLRPTKPVYEPGFLEMFSELIFAKSSCLRERVPSFFQPVFSTVRSFLATISPVSIPLLSR